MLGSFGDLAFECFQVKQKTQVTKQCLWRLDTGVCCNVDFSINFIQFRKFQTSLFGIVTVDFFVYGFPFALYRYVGFLWKRYGGFLARQLIFNAWNRYGGIPTEAKTRAFPSVFHCLSWKIITLASASRIQNRKLNFPNLPSQ